MSDPVVPLDPEQPKLPPDIDLPKSDPNAKIWGLTQEQIDALVTHIPGAVRFIGAQWPASRKWLALAGAIGAAILLGLAGGTVGRVTAPAPVIATAPEFVPIRSVKLANGKTYKLGRKESHGIRYNEPRIQFKNYVLKSLPSPPATLDYGAKSARSLGNVYLNDELGCCVVSGGWHIRGVVTGQAGKETIATNAQITADYSAIGGYVPGDSNTDQGANLQDAMNYWMKSGFAHSGGNLLGWVSLNPRDQTQTKQAIFCFENAYIGMGLPNYYIGAGMPQGDGFVWDVAGPAVPSNGHCFMVYGYNAQGLKIDTWGLKGIFTWAAAAQYLPASSGGEFYVLASEESIANGQSVAPNGFDWAQLAADFASISGGGTINPPVVIPPVVIPAPVITGPSTATAIAGQPFVAHIVASNAPTSYSATGLPAGITVNLSSGLIAGTPGTAGTFSVTLTAHNAGGTGSAHLALTVNPAPPVPVPVPPGQGTITIELPGKPKTVYQIVPSGSAPVPPAGPAIVAPKTARSGEQITVSWTARANAPEDDWIGLANGPGADIPIFSRPWRYFDGKSGSATFDLTQVPPGVYSISMCDRDNVELCKVPIVVGGPASARVDAKLAPRPPPPPRLRVLIVVDSSVLQTPEQKKILFGKNVKGWLDANCAMGPGGKTPEFRIWDQSTGAAKESKGWRDALARPRASAPWLWIGNGATLFEGPLPATEAGMLELLKKYGS